MGKSDVENNMVACCNRDYSCYCFQSWCRCRCCCSFLPLLIKNNVKLLTVMATWGKMCGKLSGKIV